MLLLRSLASCVAHPVAGAVRTTGARVVRGSARAPRLWLRCSSSSSIAIEDDAELERALRDGSGSLPLEPIVKIYADCASPNYFLPWQMKPSRQGTGSGFVIEGRRILTNAHVVADQKLVTLRKFGNPTKFPARVEAVGHDCDLALLTVEDPLFWENMYALQLGDIPQLQDSCDVIGYPTGGDNVSVTHGVVSRIEPQPYAHGSTNLLAIQIDAAINPGNSGGPALKDDLVVGVAFQNLMGAQNIGFIIPSPIINHFLEDVRRHGPSYSGFGWLGITCHPMENAHMRKFFGMGHSQTGVLVTSVLPTCAASRTVKKDDVLLKIDGIVVGNDGTVPFRKRERILLDHCFSHRFVGDSVTLTVLRDKQEIDVPVELSPAKPLVPPHLFDTNPSYFIYAGLVFTPLTTPYLTEYGEDWYNTAPRKLFIQAAFGRKTVPDQEVVILSHVLSHEVNMGYSHHCNMELLQFNGTKILNLKHLVKMVAESKEDYFRFDLDGDMVIILDRNEAQRATQTILDNYRVPSCVSHDLKPEWPHE